MEPWERFMAYIESCPGDGLVAAIIAIMVFGTMCAAILIVLAQHGGSCG